MDKVKEALCMFFIVKARTFSRGDYDFYAFKTSMG